MKSFNRVLGLTLFVLTAVFCRGAVFNSSDGQFSVDMPDGWTNAKNTVDNSVLSIIRGASRIDFKLVPECTDEACIEQRISNDLLDIKSRKMKVTADTYTGEEIKRTDFSTGEPFLYINFSTSKTDYSAGYFIIRQQAYSVLAQNITSSEADLYFSLIAPLTAQSVGGTYALPSVRQENLGAVKDFKTPAAVPPAVSTGAAAAASAPVSAAVRPANKPAAEKTSVLRKIKNALKTNKHFTFVSKNMPPVLRSMGRLVDVLVLLLAIYVCLVFVFLVAKIFKRGAAPELTVNPASPYPIKFKRLYGTPSLIFRAKDNQDAGFVSFTTRWGAEFQFFGIVFVLLCVLFMCAVSFNETFDIIKISQVHYATLYSIPALILGLGVFVWFIGAVITLVTPREFTLYNKSGKKSVYVLQKGYSFKKEIYTVYYAHTKERRTLERAKFLLKRRWRVLDGQGDQLAIIEETSASKSLCRKFLGHMWGFFRASYNITGVMESSGFIYNHNKIFDEFTANIDKPQALDALDVLVAALVINIRDIDAWHPSVN